MNSITLPLPVLAAALSHLRRLIDAESPEEAARLKPDAAAAWKAGQEVIAQQRAQDAPETAAHRHEHR